MPSPVHKCYSRLRCYNGGSSADLYLDGMHVDVSIVDVHAKATLRQRFTNSFSSAVDATYTFAMLASSAVCGFEMIRGDGTKVVGQVQEKEAAKQAFDAAVVQGKTASLGEEQTKDLFSIKVGNILAAETVTINVTFLTALTDDEKKDQVRYTFPRTYTKRYGTPPSLDAANLSSTTGLSQPFSIDVSIQMPGAIKSISSPSSYPIELSMGKPESAGVHTNTNFASVQLTRPTLDLERDFILVITATGLDSPRCFVESSDEGTTAIALTFVPRFNLPDVPNGMEYIFLVDRSGSMKGTSIQLVQQALVVLLRGLPTKKTKFNIFSFGTKTTSLWPASQDYTQQTLDEATAHVDHMAADYRGTEIGRALRTVFDVVSKDRQQPVSVFLLTDGDAWDVKRCQTITREALASPGEFMRVFTVGIGNSVSTDTVNSIARAGEGMAIYVQDGEPMTGKLARLVRASRVSSIQDIRVLWPGANAEPFDDFEMVEAEEFTPETQGPVNLFDDAVDDMPKDVGPPPKPEVDATKMFVPFVQQAPLAIPNLFPGTRTQIYSIISTSALPLDQFPSSVKVCGTVATTGAPVQLEVAITRSSSSLIHTLAARSLITDREDGKHEFAPSVASRSDVLEAHLQADIIRLGTKYGLASKHTSYIAIDEAHPDQCLGTRGDPPRSQGGSSTETVAFSSLAPTSEPVNFSYSTFSPFSPDRHSVPLGGAPPTTFSPIPPDPLMILYPQTPHYSPTRPPYSGPVGHAPAPTLPYDYLPSFLPTSSVYSPTPAYSSAPSNDSPDSLLEKLRQSVPMPSSSAPLDGSPASLLMNLRQSVSMPRKVRCAMPRRRRDQAGDSRKRVAPAGSDSDDPPPGNGDDPTTAVARLQQFDGCFVLSDKLLKAVGSDKTVEDVSQTVGGGQYSDEVLATCIAVLWLEKEAEEEGQDMINKALDWLAENMAQGALVDLKEVVRQYIFNK